MNSNLNLIDFIDADTQTTANQLFVLFDQQGNNRVTFESFVSVLVQSNSVSDYHQGWHCLSSLRQNFHAICQSNATVTTTVKPHHTFDFASLLTYLQQKPR